MPEEVEVIAYGGKDALKNSIMLKFVIEKFNRVYITYDLDAHNELQKIMMHLGLEIDRDYMPVGVDKPGKDCIEGLLSQGVLSSVYGNNADTVMKLTSVDNKLRKSAKNELKKKLLEELKKAKNVAASDLKDFKPLFANINKAFNL